MYIQPDLPQFERCDPFRAPVEVRCFVRQYAVGCRFACAQHRPAHISLAHPLFARLQYPTRLVSLTLDWVREEEWFYEPGIRLRMFLAAASIRRLRLSRVYGADLSGEEWTAVFRRMTCLEELVIYRGGCIEESLLPQAHHAPRLTLVRISLDEHERYDLSESIDAATIQALLAATTERSLRISFESLTEKDDERAEEVTVQVRAIGSERVTFVNGAKHAWMDGPELWRTYGTTRRLATMTILRAVIQTACRVEATGSSSPACRAAMKAATVSRRCTADRRAHLDQC